MKNLSRHILAVFCVMSLVIACTDQTAGPNLDEVDFETTPLSQKFATSKDQVRHKPIETTFTATLTNVEVVSERVLPNGTVITEIKTFFDFTGDWEGTSNSELIQTYRTNGVETSEGIINFEGTILGYEGTVQINWNAKSPVNENAAYGRFTILSGTGELANLRGHGTGDDLVDGVFEDVTTFVHFAP